MGDTHRDTLLAALRREIDEMKATVSKLEAAHVALAGAGRSDGERPEKRKAANAMMGWSPELANAVHRAAVETAAGLPSISERVKVLMSDGTVRTVSEVTNTLSDRGPSEVMRETVNSILHRASKGEAALYKRLGGGKYQLRQLNIRPVTVSAAGGAR